MNLSLVLLFQLVLFDKLSLAPLIARDHDGAGRSHLEQSWGQPCEETLKALLSYKLLENCHVAL